MRPVLFVPETTPADASVTAMFKQAQQGLRCPVRLLAELGHIGDGETPVIAAVYTEENREGIRAYLQTGRRFVVLDHTWFGDAGIRGNHFRVVANAFQPSRLVEAPPDMDRYRALGLAPVREWQPENPGGKVLLLPHSDRFGQIFDLTPDQFIDWALEELTGVGIDTVGGIAIRYRYPQPHAPHKAGAEAQLQASRLAVGFNTELLIRALRLGIPAIGHPRGSVVYAFNRLLPGEAASHARLTATSVEEREHLCATLATHYQLSVDELAQPGRILEMAERQQQPLSLAA